MKEALQAARKFAVVARDIYGNDTEMSQSTVTDALKGQLDESRGAFSEN